MSRIIHHSPVALSYAQALLELAGDAAPRLRQELALLAQAIAESPVLRRFMENPTLDTQARLEALERALRPRVDPLLWNFLGVLNRKGRLGLLPQIAAAFDELVRQSRGEVQVRLTVAHELDEARLQQIAEKLGAAWKRTAMVSQRVDPAIVGGLVARVGDQLIDASVLTQLQALKRQMLAAAPRFE